MPHKSCSVCAHPEREKIDAALKGREPVRSVAGRFRLSKTAIARHAAAHVLKPVTQTSDLTAIDKEILKIQQALGRAKSKRDTRSAVQFSRELRSWFELRAKVATTAAATKTDAGEELNPVEALQLARSLIEADLARGGQETREWLSELANRSQSTIDAMVEEAKTE